MAPRLTPRMKERAGALSMPMVVECVERWAVGWIATIVRVGGRVDGLSRFDGADDEVA